MEQTITVNVAHWDSQKAMFIDVPETAILTNIEGHDAYILKSAIDGETYPNGFVSHRTNVYRADGSIIRCAWVFGPTGKADRWGALTYEAKKQFIIRTTNGLNGATMRGYGARLKFIDWDGTKYAEAIEKSKRTGKRILYA